MTHPVTPIGHSHNERSSIEQRAVVQCEAPGGMEASSAQRALRRNALRGLVRAVAVPAAVSVLVSPLAACAGRRGGHDAVASTGREVTRLGSEWTYLIEQGQGLNRFRRYGTADWAVVDGTLQARTGGPEPSYLVTPEIYDDIEVRAEVWLSEDSNSGIFLRCQTPDAVSERSAYEANLFDQRPDPTYGTGSIVNVASVPEPRPRAGGRWNTVEFRAKGPRLTVRLNGVQTADVEDQRFLQGPLALQWGRGTVRFRHVMVRRPV